MRISQSCFSYLSATVFSEVGNTSENRGSLSEEELMKLTVKETMNSNIKKQMICGSIALVGGIVGYFFIGLFSTRCLYNFKKNILEQFYHKNRDFLIYAMFLNLHLKYRHN